MPSITLTLPVELEVTLEFTVDAPDPENGMELGGAEDIEISAITGFTTYGVVPPWSIELETKLIDMAEADIHSAARDLL